MSNKILNVNIKVTLRPGWRNQCKTSGSCPCRPQALPRPARWRWRWSRQQRCWRRRRERQRRRRCKIQSVQFCTTGLAPGPHRSTTLNLGVSWGKMVKMQKQRRNSRDPTLAGLDCKKSEHGVEAVVIVEVFACPPVNPPVFYQGWKWSMIK